MGLGPAPSRRVLSRGLGWIAKLAREKTNKRPHGPGGIHGQPSRYFGNMLNTCTPLAIALVSGRPRPRNLYFGVRQSHRVGPILDYHIPNPTPSHNQACALRVESELHVCLHGRGCWARARALARTFSSTSSSTSFDEAKGGHRVGRSPPHARNTHVAHARARMHFVPACLRMPQPPSSPLHIVPSRTCAQPYPSPPLSQALTLTRHAG